MKEKELIEILTAKKKNGAFKYSEDERRAAKHELKKLRRGK